MMPSFKHIASIFPEISFIRYLPLFSFKPYVISKTQKDNSKRKTPFFHILKGLSNKHKLFFISWAL